MRIVFTTLAILFFMHVAYAQNVGIGTTTPVNKLSVVGKVNITDSLGVGITTPASVLHLQSANVSDTSRGDIILARYWNNNTDTRASSIFHYDNTSSNSDNLAFGVAGNGGSFNRPNSLNQIKMLIQANGNVGIGTLKPTQKLDVAGTTKTTNLQITNGASNGFILKSDVSGNASWVNANTIETDPKVGTLTSNQIPKWNGTSLINGLIYDNGTRVGIGTITPSRKLTVVDPSSIGIAQLSGSPTSNTSIGIGRTDVEGTLNIAGNTNEFANGTLPGDIVLRTESNTQRLILNSGNGAAALTILNGNTGIGNTTPAQKLDVSGTTKTTNLQITNGAGNGFVLKSDASGNASWVNANTIETDPKVGTLTSNQIPKWNGTSLINGLIYDNGTRVGIGTTNPINKLTVVQPSGIGIAELSDNLSSHTSIGIGRTAVEGTLNVAAASGEFAANAVAGDVILRTQSTASRLILNNGAGQAALTVNDNNIGIGTTNPAGQLHVKSFAISESILDQQQPNFFGWNSGNINWQSFTAGSTGALTRVDLYISSPLSPNTSPGTIKIFSGEGNSGTLLSTTPVTYQPTASFQSFTLSNFPYVVAGNKYTIEFSAPVQNVIWAALQPGDPYTGGICSAINFYDFAFKTYVTSVLADGLVIQGGQIGINTASPSTTLDVDGGIRTKYSGSEVVNLGVGTHTVNITMPNAVPASWNNSNTIAMVINGDGAEGFVRAAKITSPTNIQVRFQQDQGGFVRLNWVILKL